MPSASQTDCVGNAFTASLPGRTITQQVQDMVEPTDAKPIVDTAEVLKGKAVPLAKTIEGVQKLYLQNSSPSSKESKKPTRVSMHVCRLSGSREEREEKMKNMRGIVQLNPGGGITERCVQERDEAKANLQK